MMIGHFAVTGRIRRIGIRASPEETTGTSTWTAAEDTPTEKKRPANGPTPVP